MSKLAPGQLDLFTVIEQAKRDAPAPTLYGSPTRGVAARTAEFTTWCQTYGSFGSYIRSHAWTLGLTCPGSPTDRCQPTVLNADLRSTCDCPTSCCCVGDLMYRGACRHCAWEGPAHTRENAAAENACDHAWPGWRELPLVPRVPDERKKRATWVEYVNQLYPPGWLEHGGPIRTERPRGGTRHVPDRTPFGGYDLAATNTTTPDNTTAGRHTS